VSAVLDLRSSAQGVALSLADAGPLQGAAVATWRGRMVNEHASAAVFDALATQMLAAGFGAPAADACRAFAAEERRHGVLCGAVVEALGGAARAEVGARAPLPSHPATSPRVAVLRNWLSVGCMSETVAVALIGMEREEMPEGALRDLLTTIWADEIGHARFGWNLLREHVPALSDEERAALARYLPWALAHLEAHELAHLPAQRAPAGGEALGLCSGLDARHLLYDTIEGVIVPELEHLGLPAQGAWARHRRPTAAA
jgi:hypothetical protein